MSNSFAVLTTFDYLHEARQVQGILQDIGISAFLNGEMTTTTFSANRSLGSEIKLFVHQADLKRALDILSLFREAAPPGWDEDYSTEEGYWICSGCHEPIVEERSTCPWCQSKRLDESES